MAPVAQPPTHCARCGVDHWQIDGAGCDSGDPLDFTLAEVMQGCGYFIDQLEALKTASVQPPTAQAEQAEQVAQGIVDEFFPEPTILKQEYKVRLVRVIASALTTSQSRGAELQREADANVLCGLCRRPEDYHAAEFDTENEVWLHKRVGHEAHWAEECAAANIRAAKQQ